jgi:hypothetical protein
VAAISRRTSASWRAACSASSQTPVFSSIWVAKISRDALAGAGADLLEHFLAGGDQAAVGVDQQQLLLDAERQRRRGAEPVLAAAVFVLRPAGVPNDVGRNPHSVGARYPAPSLL